MKQNRYTLFFVGICCVFCAVFGIMASCNRYEKVVENSPFIIRCNVLNENVVGDVALVVSISEGTVKGDCSLSLSIKDAASGDEVSGYQVYTSGGTVLQEGDEWSFDSDGDARFIIRGLGRGNYRLKALVTRWYHSASAEADFTIIE